MGVQRDLAFGKIGEDKIVTLLNEVGIDSKRQPKAGRFSDYDIESSFQGSDFTIEVKYDIYAVRSGNIAIEVFNPKIGKPSGLMATKADFWAHITDEVHISRVDSLKTWVNDNPPKRTISSGGDDNATLYLYAKDFIFVEPLFIRIDNLSKTDRQNAIKGLLNLDELQF